MIIRCGLDVDTYNAWLGVTPGERAHFDIGYKLQSYEFCRKNDIDHHDRFMKVRIIREAGAFRIPGAWWMDKHWQDETFWCYQTPVKMFHKDSPQDAHLAYALEPLECERVRLYELARTGHHKFSIGDSLIVPCDCCDQCWNETSAGVSEHRRERAPIEDVRDPDMQDEHLTTDQKLRVLKTEQDKEEEAELEKKSAKIQERIQDVNEDPKWNKNLDTNIFLQ